jgi:hypothetical protein
MRYARKYLSSLSVSVVCGGSWLAFGFLTNREREREREEEEERRERSLNERSSLSSSSSSPVGLLMVTPFVANRFWGKSERERNV